MALDRRLVVIVLGRGLGLGVFGDSVLMPRTPHQGDPARTCQFNDLVRRARLR